MSDDRHMADRTSDEQQAWLDETITFLRRQRADRMAAAILIHLGSLMTSVQWDTLASMVEDGILTREPNKRNVSVEEVKQAIVRLQTELSVRTTEQHLKATEPYFEER